MTLKEWNSLQVGDIISNLKDKRRRSIISVDRRGNRVCYIELPCLIDIPAKVVFYSADNRHKIKLYSKYG